MIDWQSPDIRRADIDDVLELTSLHDSYWSEPVDLAQSFVSGDSVFVAEVDGAVVGYVATARFAPEVLEVITLLVASGYRSYGIGRHLLDAVEQEARRDDYEGVLVSNSDLHPTREPKWSAERFYIRSGFDPIVRTTHTVVLFKSLSD